MFKHIHDVLVVEPGERLDITTASEVERALMVQIDAGHHRMVIDFGPTEYISSAGLRVLIKVAKRLRPMNGVLVLCNGNSQVHEVLQVSGFVDMLEYQSSLDAALKRVAGLS